MSYRFAFVLAVLPALASAATWEAFKAVVSKDFFQNAVNQPITQSKSVSDYVSGTVIHGTALTSATVAVDFMPSDQFAGIWVRVDSQTNASTLGVNTPRNDVTVNIQAASFTTMTTWKPVFIMADRIATNAASSQARTTINYEGIGVEADGLFWRLKTRVAERKAWEQAYASKAQNEMRTSEKIAGEMNKMLDDKAGPMLAELNKFYQRVVYGPLFAEGRVPGKPKYATTSSTLSAAVALDDMTAETPPAPTGSTPVYLWLHEELPARIFTRDLAGKHFDEEDLEEYLVASGIPAGLGRYRGAEQIGMDFCAAQPMRAHFTDEKVSVELCLEKARLKDRALGRGTLIVEYATAIDEKGALSFKRAGAPRLSGASTEMLTRFARIFPERMAFGTMHLPGGTVAPAGDLRVSRKAFANGWALVEWAFDREGGY